MKVKEFFRRIGSLELHGKPAIHNDDLEVLCKDKSSDRLGVLADIKSVRLNNKDQIVIELEE